MSPLERESRMAAQFAPFATVASMPCFLKKPFSWAMTIGEQSVRAMMPNRIAGCSGESSAYAVPVQPRGKPASKAAASDRRRKRRRDGSGSPGVIGPVDIGEGEFVGGIMGGRGGEGLEERGVVGSVEEGR